MIQSLPIENPDQLTLPDWEKHFETMAAEISSLADPAHDILHLRRVVQTAKKLAREEGGNLLIIAPAAWLHDLVVTPKNSPLRVKASQLSAQAAQEYLKRLNYPDKLLDEIAHAIEAHSFSAGISPRSLEAKIVQDADRLDGLGAIGIARCFATAGSMGRSFYDQGDPLCKSRTPDDQRFTIDHFFQKLFKTAESLQTLSGMAEGVRRVRVMQEFLTNFEGEISQEQ